MVECVIASHRWGEPFAVGISNLDPVVVSKSGSAHMYVPFRVSSQVLIEITYHHFQSVGDCHVAGLLVTVKLAHCGVIAIQWCF
jgi:hypothetical protein